MKFLLVRGWKLGDTEWQKCHCNFESIISSFALTSTRLSSRDQTLSLPPSAQPCLANPPFQTHLVWLSHRQPSAPPTNLPWLALLAASHRWSAELTLTSMVRFNTLKCYEYQTNGLWFGHEIGTIWWIHKMYRANQRQLGFVFIRRIVKIPDSKPQYYLRRKRITSCSSCSMLLYRLIRGLLGWARRSI